MAGILRGEIGWADLNPAIRREQSGNWPVLLQSHDVFDENSGTAIAMAVTSQPPRAGYPRTLELTIGQRESWVNIRQIRTLSV
jgi:mRNA interferase MazF